MESTQSGILAVVAKHALKTENLFIFVRKLPSLCRIMAFAQNILCPVKRTIRSVPKQSVYLANSIVVLSSRNLSLMPKNLLCLIHRNLKPFKIMYMNFCVYSNLCIAKAQLILFYCSLIKCFSMI